LLNFLLKTKIKLALNPAASKIIFEVQSNPSTTNTKKVAVVQKVSRWSKVSAQFCSHYSWVGDLGWPLLTSGCCSKVVLNTGLTV
jgi:hypothetical protein